MMEVTNTTLMDHLDELAAFEPNEFPFAPDSLELGSFKLAATRIMSYLRNEVRSSANGIAIFECVGPDVYFKTVQLDAPIQQHRLHISDRPHLYPLARVIDQHPRYVALLADTNAARLFVFDLGKVLSSEEVHRPKLSRTQVEGWSQMRYQRHVDNYHVHHAKEVVEMLDRVVREEAAEHIVLAGDVVIIPLLREHLPGAPHLIAADLLVTRARNTGRACDLHRGCGTSRGNRRCRCPSALSTLITFISRPKPLRE